MDNDIGAKTAFELFEAAPCGYLFTLPDGTISRVNQTFLAWTGFSSADLVGRKRFQEMLSIPAAIFYETHFAPLLRMQGFVKEITVDFLRADGTTLPALVNSVVQSTAEGVPELVRTTVFDIRERRRYERELLYERSKAEHLAAVVENASDAIITTDPDLHISSWNSGAETLFQYTRAEAIGRKLPELIVPDSDREKLERSVAKLRAGEAVHFETVLINKERQPAEVSVSVTPHIEPPGELVGFSAILRDIRARKRTEEALIRSEQLASAGKMAAALAHQINNPLAGAMNALYLATSGGGVSAEPRRYLDLADGELKRISHVTRQVLGFYRESMLPEKMELGGVLDSVLEFAQIRAQAKHIQFRQRYAKDLHLFAVAGELRQLFSSLLLNSVEAIADEGAIVVRARHVGSGTNKRVRVTIADSGEGIANPVRAKVFDPLFTTKGNVNAGLGLWVSKQIVQRHGGTIKVRSRASAPRRGTTVWVELPVTG